MLLIKFFFRLSLLLPPDITTYYLNFYPIYFGGHRKMCYFCTTIRKIGRVTECAGLEIRYTLSGYRGFESLIFRQRSSTSKSWDFFCVQMRASNPRYKVHISSFCYLYHFCIEKCYCTSLPDCYRNASIRIH